MVCPIKPGSIIQTSPGSTSRVGLANNELKGGSKGDIKTLGEGGKYIFSFQYSSAPEDILLLGTVIPLTVLDISLFTKRIR